MQRFIRASRDGDRAVTGSGVRLARDLRGEHLLACAVHVFAEHGLVASNHDLVAAAADVSVAAVFSHFRTRRALVEAVLSEVERFFFATIEPTDDPELTADEELTAIGRALTEAASTHPDHCAILLEWSVAVRSETWPRFLGLHRAFVERLAELIERGRCEGSLALDLDPEEEAAVLHAAFIAFIQMKETGASAERLDGFGRRLVRSRGWLGRLRC